MDFGEVGSEEGDERSATQHNTREEKEEKDALGSEWQEGGGKESEPSGRYTKSAEMVEAAQRAGNRGWRQGRVPGGVRDG